MLLGLPSAEAAASVVLLRDAPSPSLLGQSVLLGARVDVTGAAPTGTVTLGDDDASCVATLPEATCLWTPTSTGTKSLTARYSGDSNHAQATSAVVMHAVEASTLPERLTLGGAVTSYQPDEAGLYFDVSDDGRYVAFLSSRTDLVANDTNAAVGVFVVDRMTGQVQRVSVANDGSQANAVSSRPTISRDGKKVAFQSAAFNLIASDTNGQADIFVRDLQANTTIRVNQGSLGEPNAGASAPVISADGSRVVYQSAATNLVSGDSNGVDDIFVYTIAGGNTQRVSISGTAAQANGASTQPTLSQDGDLIAFRSVATNLVTTDTNGGSADVFVHRITNGVTFIASLNEANAVTASQSVSSAYPGISADGRFVAFESVSNYVSTDTAGFTDLFRRDIVVNTTLRVSLADDESQPNAGVQAVVGRGISADGVRVLFASAASKLVSGDGNLNFDLYLRDVDFGTTKRLTLRADGSEASLGFGDFAALSGDGTTALFRASTDGGFVPGGSLSAIVVRSIAANKNSGLLPESSGNQLRVGAGSFLFDPSVSMSSDGRYVVFSSDDDHLVAGDTNRATDVFLRDRQTRAVTRVSVDPNLTEGNGNSSNARISADGRYIVYQSLANNIEFGDANGVSDIFRYDRMTGNSLRVSVTPAGSDADQASDSAVISNDGRWIAFVSSATNLVSGDTNGVADVFLWDGNAPQSSRIRRVSESLLGAQGSAAAVGATISGDGSRVAFSSAADLFTSDASADGLSDVFLRDYSANTLSLVSRLGSGSEGTLSYVAPLLSNNGRKIAFLAASGGEDFEGDGVTESPAGGVIVVRDLDGQTNQVASRCAGVNQLASIINLTPPPYALSGDGRYLAYASGSLACTADDTDAAARNHVFVRDLSTGETRLADRDANGVQANGHAAGSAGNALAVSIDGSAIVFGSTASTLVTGDSNGLDDLFLTANPAYRTDALQSVSNLTSAANAASRKATLSMGGRYLVFESDASNLATAGSADTNGFTDVYRRDLQTGQVVRISLGDGGQQLEGAAVDPVASADGDFVIFAAPDAAVALSKHETPEQRAKRKASFGASLFLRQIGIGSTVALAQVATSTFYLNQLRGSVSLSPDKKWLAYVKTVPAAVGDTNNQPDVVLRNMLTQSETCISCFTLNQNGTPTTTPTNGAASSPAISNDGKVVAFVSKATNPVTGISATGAGIAVVGLNAKLVPNGGSGGQSIPAISGMNMGVINLQQQQAITQATNAVSVASNIQSKTHRMLMSIIANIAARKGAATQNVIVYDEGDESLTRVSQPAAGGDANGSSSDAAISGDGNTIVFRSSATNLDVADADTNGADDLFVYDVRSKSTRRLSRTREGGEANAASQSPSLDYTGSRIAFESAASNIDGNDNDGGQTDLFLRTNPLVVERVFSSGFD